MNHIRKAKKMAVIVVFLLSATYVFSEKIATFPDLLNPGVFAVRDDRLYVTEGAEISIYSLKDFKLIKKFGRKGEGPREFKVTSLYDLVIDVYSKYICINSVGKVSFFTLDGEYIKEKKIPFRGGNMQPFGENNYVGFSNIPDKNYMSLLTVDIYDSNLKKVREIHRQHSQINKNGEIDASKQIFLYRVAGNRIFIVGESGFVIQIYDGSGNLIHTIKREIEKRKVTDADKKEIHKIFKRENPNAYRIFKDKLVFQEYWRVIDSIIVRNKKVYVMTITKPHGTGDLNKFEYISVFIFDLDGKFIKKGELPVYKKNIFQAYPFDIWKGKIYQFIENEDEEEWELHKAEIK